jgi:hypothetical protein
VEQFKRPGATAKLNTSSRFAYYADCPVTKDFIWDKKLLPDTQNCKGNFMVHPVDTCFLEVEHLAILTVIHPFKW